MKTRYIHIGYPKNASSTLQNHFFSKHPELLHLGIPLSIPYQVWNKIRIDILRKNSFRFSLSEVKQALSPYLDSADNKYKAVGISYEGLCMGPVDPAIVAKRLRDVFGDAKILIIVRNQFDSLSSKYNQCIRAGAYFSFTKYLEAQYWMLYDSTSVFNTLYYYDIYKCYQDLFGEDAVKIFLFEDFVRDTNNIIKELCRFLKVSPVSLEIKRLNRGNSRFSLWGIRLVNRIYKTNLGQSYFMPRAPSTYIPMHLELNYIPRGVMWQGIWRGLIVYSLFGRIDRIFNLKTTKQRLPKDWKRRVIELYKENNQKLMNDTGLDLQKYNYPL